MSSRFLIAAIFLLLVNLISPGHAYAACSGSAAFSVSTPVCVNSAISFTNSSSSGAKRFTWDWGDGSSTTTKGVYSTQTHTYSSAGTFTVKLVWDDSTGCKDSITHNVTVNSFPAASTGSNRSICYGASTTIGASSVTGNSYSWVSNPSGFTSSSSNPSVSPTVTTTYTLTETNSGGCSKTNSVTVTVNALPTVNFSFSPDSACSGTSVAFTNSSAGSGLSYKWDFGDGATSTGSSPNHAFDTSGNTYISYSVKLTVTNSNGCSSSVTKTVKVYSHPDPQLTDTLNIFSPFTNCDASSSSTSFTVGVSNTTTDTSIVQKYQIDWGDGSSVANYTPPFYGAGHTYSSLGVYTLKFTTIGKNGCSKTHSYKVINESNPSVGITSPSSTIGCLPQTFWYKLSARDVSPSTTFTWDFDDGTTQVWDYTKANDTVYHTFNTTSCGRNQPSYSCNNCYVVKVTAKNNCWTKTAYVNNTLIYDKPHTTFSIGSDTNCVNTTVPISNQTSANCYSKTVWVWNFGNSKTSTDSVPKFNVTYTSPGIYTITLVAKNKCSSDTVKKKIVIDAVPVASFTKSTSSTTNCSPLTETFTNKSTGGFLRHFWSVTPSSGVSFSGSSDTSASPTIVFSDSGRYIVSLTEKNYCGSNTVKDTIIVKGKPVAALPADAVYCGTQTIDFSTDANHKPTYKSGFGTITSYSWSISGSSGATYQSSSSSSSQYPVIQFPSPGVYTVSVTATNECGTSAAATQKITINAPPTAHPGSNQFICYGKSVTIGASPSGSGGTGTLTYAWSATGGFSSSQANPTVNPTTTTRYHLIVTDSKGCQDSGSMVVIVNPRLTANAGVTKFICFGKDTVLGNGSSTASGGTAGYTYSWSPGATLDDSTKMNPTARPLQTTRFVLTVTDSKGCTDTSSEKIIVNPQLIAAAGTGRLICYGDSATLGGSPSASGGKSPYSYAWTSSPAGFTSSATNPVVKPTSSTKYTLKVTDSKGCTDTNSITITVNPKITVDAGRDTLICYGSGISIGGSPSASGGNGTLSYQWTPSTGLSSTTAANPTASPLSTTQYKLTVTDAKGCKVSDSVKVSVNPQLIAKAGSNQSICYGSSVVIGGTSTGGTAPYTYSWSPATRLDNANIAKPKASPLSTTKYTLTITDSKGCTDTNSVLVTVDPKITANAGSNQFICYNSNVTLGGSTLATGGTSPYTYAWASTDGTLSSTLANPVFKLTSSKKFLLTVTDAKGCTDTQSVNVTVNPQLTAKAGSWKEICYGASTVIGNNASGGTGPYTYAWSPSTGLNDSTKAQPTASPLSSTTYQVTVTDAKGCTSTDTVSVRVLPVLHAHAGTDKTICYGSYVTIGGSPAASGSSGVYTSYSWSPTTGLSSSSIANPVAGPASSTDYVLTVTDSKGCTAKDTVTITVKPKITVNAGAGTTICNGKSLTLGGAIVARGGQGSFTYKWSPSTGLSSTTDSLPIAAPSSTTTYKLVVTDAGGCKDSSSVTITVNPRPTPAIFGTSSVCLGDTLSYSTPNHSGSTYIWKVQNGVIVSGSSTNQASVHWATTGSGKITVIETDSHGCTDSASATITIHSLPVADAGKDSTICFGNTATIGTAAVSGYSYSWKSSDGLFTSTNASPAVSPEQTTTYHLIVTNNSTGCKSTDDVVVTVNPLPAADAGSDKSICKGNSVQIGSTAISGRKYSWTSTNSFTDTTANPTVAPSSTVTYYLKVTNRSTGCSNYDTVVVTVTPLPSTPAITINSPLCEGDSLKLSTSVVSGASYYWTGPNGFSSTSRIPAKASVTQADSGLYSLYIAVNGCLSATVQKRLIVNPLPSPSAGSNASTCKGDSVQIGYAGTAGDTYAWTSNPSGYSSSQPHPYVKPTVTTTYYLAETNPITGCHKQVQVVITVNPRPTPSVSGASGVCAGDTQQYSVTNTGNTFSWSVKGGSIISGAGTSSISVGWGSSGTAEVKVIETNSYGCADSSKYPVTIHSLPSADAGANRFICYKEKITLGGSPSASGGTPGYTYSWKSSPAGFTSGSANPIVQPLVTTVYTLQVTDANGCKAGKQVTITVNPKLTANAGRDTAICKGKTMHLGGAIIGKGGTGPLSYAWSPSAYISSVSDSSPVFTASDTGSFVYRLVLSDSKSCNDTSYIKVRVNPLPAPAISGSHVVCAGATATYSTPRVSGNSYAWTITGGTISSGSGTNSITVVWGNGSSGKLSLTESVGSSGCQDTTSGIVIIDPLPLANTGTAKVICVNDTVQIGSTAVSGNSYKWTPSAGLSNDTLSSPLAYPGSTTVYTLTETIRATGCKKSDTVSVIVNTRPAPSISGNKIVCASSTQSYSCTAATGDTYLWAVRGGTIASGQGSNSISVNWGSTASGKVILKETSPHGCSSYDSIDISITPLPTATISGSTTICSGDNATLTLSVSNVASTQSWRIAYRKGGSSADSTITGTGSGSFSLRTSALTGTTTYTLTAISETSGSLLCSNTLSGSATVTVNNLPTATISGSDTICYGEDTKLTIAVSNVASGQNWTLHYRKSGSTADSTMSGTGSGTFILRSSALTSSTDYTLTSIAETSGSPLCSNTLSSKASVTVNPLPAATISSNTTICAGEIVNLTITVSNVQSGQKWNISYRKGNSTIDSIFSGTGNGSFTLRTSSLTSTTTYKLKGISEITMSPLCRNTLTDSVTITVSPLPTANAGSNNTICAGDKIMIGGSPSASGGTGGYSYSWSPATGLDDASKSNPTANPSTTTSYTLTVTDSKGCKATSGMTITVNPKPIADAGVDQSMCLNDSIKLGGSRVAYHGTAPYTYTWSPDSNLSSGTDSIPVFKPHQTGTYKFSLTLSDSKGCTASDTVLIKVNTLPTPSVAGNGVVCAGSLAVYKTNKVSGNSYAWAVQGGTILSGSNNDSVIVGWESGAAGRVRVLESIGISGCQDSAWKVITINPLPQAYSKTSKTICIHDTVQIGFSAVSGHSYSWFPSAGLSSSTVSNPQAYPLSTTTYVLTETIAATGCINRDTVVITVNPRPTPKVKGNSSVCAASAETYSTTASGSDTYAWTVNGGTIKSGSGTNSISIAWGSTGSGYVTVRQANASTGCAKDDTLSITINPLPLAKTGTNKEICFGDSTAIGASAVSGNTYAWTSKPTGFTSSLSQPKVSPAVTTTYYLTETITATGCKRSDSVKIIVHPLPKADAGSSTTICFGDSAQIGNTAVAGDAYQWTSYPSGFTSTLSKLYVHPTVTTTYYLTETDTTTHCFKSDSVKITVKPLPSTPAASNNGPLCNGFDLHLFSSSLSGATYSWTGPNGFTSSLQNPTISKATTADSGRYGVTVGYNGCTSYAGYTRVIIYPLPTVSAGIDDSTCIDRPAFALSGQSPTGGYWRGTGITDSIKGIFDPSKAGKGIFTLLYRYFDAHGCENTSTRKMKVNPLPIVDAGKTDTFCNQSITTTLKGQTPLGGVWHGKGVDTTGVFTPSVAGLGTHTLTYIYKDPHGCSDSAQKTVVVIDPPVVVAGSNDTLCIDRGSYKLSGYSPSGGSWSGKGIAADGTFDTKKSDTGKFILTYTYGTGTCQVTASKIMRVNPLPIVDAGTDQDICISVASYSLSGNSPTGGWWSGQGITDSVNGTFIPSKAGLGRHRILYFYKHPKTGCLNYDSVFLFVRPLPKAGFTADTLYCKNSSMPFKNTSAGAATYLWSFGDGDTSTANSPNHVYTSKGSYTIRLVSTSTYGCNDTAYARVRITELPDAKFTLSTHSGCAPVTVSFNNQSTGEIKGYSWDFGDGTSSILAQPPPVTYKQSRYKDTTYYITLTLSSFCGSVSYKDSVIVKPLPIADFFTNRTSGCSPLGINFNNSSLGSATSYFWDLGNGRTSTRQFPPTQVYLADTTDTTYHIMLVASNACGTDTMRHTVLVHPKTVFSLFTSDTTEGCAPLTVNFSDHSRGGSYMSWDFGDGNVSNGVKKPVHTYTKGGRYIVKQYVNNGCSYDTTESVINVFDKPNVKWTVTSNTICAKQQLVFNNASTNVSNYFWDFGDGGTSNLSNPTHIYRQPGHYKVMLRSQSNAYKCFSSYSDSVFILPLPDLSMKADTWQGCQPFTIHISKPAKANEFYNWDFGDGNTAVGASQMHTYKDTGDYTVILYARNTNGCYDTALQKVHVFPVSKSSFSMSITSACNGPADVQFTNTSIGAQGYLWLFGNGRTSTDNNPSAHYDSTGDYLVQLVTYNRFNCTDTSKQHFIIYHTPVADFSVKPVSGCQPLSVQFQNHTHYATDFEWDFGDGESSNDAAPLHIYQKAGNYTVSLKATNGKFCSDTIVKEKLITVYPIAVAGFSWALHLAPFFDGSVAFTNTSSDGGLCFWDFGDGDTSSGCDPVHRYKDFKQYRVMQVVRTPYGCADTTYRTIDVTIEKNLAVPNAMMPLAGPEDVRIFKPSGRGLLTYHLQIFDRWGELLWETDSLDNGHPAIGWDGYYKGKLCEQDVYVWKIEATFLDGEIWEGKDYNGTKKKMGSVHLIR